MEWLVVGIGFVVLVAVVVLLAIRYGKKDVISDQLEEELKRAKKAKDISGADLSDDFLRPRD